MIRPDPIISDADAFGLGLAAVQYSMACQRTRYARFARHLVESGSGTNGAPAGEVLDFGAIECGGYERRARAAEALMVAVQAIDRCVSLMAPGDADDVVDHVCAALRGSRPGPKAPDLAHKLADALWRLDLPDGGEAPAWSCVQAVDGTGSFERTAFAVARLAAAQLDVPGRAVVVARVVIAAFMEGRRPGEARPDRATDKAWMYWYACTAAKALATSRSRRITDGVPISPAMREVIARERERERGRGDDVQTVDAGPSGGARVTAPSLIGAGDAVTGAALQRIRATWGLTQAELARLLGASLAGIRNYEQGVTPTVPAEYAVAARRLHNGWISAGRIPVTDGGFVALANSWLVALGYGAGDYAALAKVLRKPKPTTWRWFAHPESHPTQQKIQRYQSIVDRELAEREKDSPYEDGNVDDPPTSA